MFDVFENRLTIKGVLETQTGLRVGTGRSTEPVGTDLPVLRDALGHPYIPGSTLKGVVRAMAEQIVRSVIPGTSGACFPTGQEEEQCISRTTMAELRNQVNSNDEPELIELLNDKFCLVCLTFGSPWLASHVHFRDLPVKQDQWFDQFQVRDGVGIDRDTGAVGEGLLYDYETVPAGTQFGCTIALENCKPWQQGLIWLALQPFLRGEAMIGGFRSRGLGWVKLLTPEMHLLEATNDISSFIDNLLTEGKPVEPAMQKEWIAALKTQLKERAQAITEKDMPQDAVAKEQGNAQTSIK